MTNSSLVTVTMLSPFHSVRNQPITKITPHHVAGNLTVEAVGRIFQTPGRNASSNYGIGQGRVAMYVEEKNRAWTSSSAWNDNRAVTFEVANCKGAPNWEISDLDWNTMVNLCVDICQRNPGIVQKDGKTPGLWFDGTQNGSLTFHRFYQKTSCPGNHIFNQARRLCDEVNARLEMESMTQEKFNEMCDAWLDTRSNMPVSAWAVEGLKEAKKAGLTDGQRPRSFATREEVAVMVSRAMKN